MADHSDARAARKRCCIRGEGIPKISLGNHKGIGRLMRLSGLRGVSEPEVAHDHPRHSARRAPEPRRAQLDGGRSGLFPGGRHHLYPTGAGFLFWRSFSTRGVAVSSAERCPLGRGGRSCCRLWRWRSSSGDQAHGPLLRPKECSTHRSPSGSGAIRPAYAVDGLDRRAHDNAMCRELLRDAGVRAPGNGSASAPMRRGRRKSSLRPPLLVRGAWPRSEAAAWQGRSAPAFPAPSSEGLEAGAKNRGRLLRQTIVPENLARIRFAHEADPGFRFAAEVLPVLLNALN
jgi:hypothetical protein